MNMSKPYLVMKLADGIWHGVFQFFEVFPGGMISAEDSGRRQELTS